MEQAIFVPRSYTNIQRMLGQSFQLSANLSNVDEGYKGHQQTNSVTKSKYGQISLFIFDCINEKVRVVYFCCFVLPALDSCSFGVLSLFIYLVCDNFKT